ncbi:MAG TPA: LPS assembly lipoprotein LptE [Steroidobacteraceae bacterium]|jgi:LPS-assembly lipoprotein
MARPSGAARGAVRAAVAAGILALAGCGFHLQGHTPLPDSMKAAYVQAPDSRSDFVQSLRKAMIISGGHPADHKDRSTAVVNITKDEVTHRVLSVSAANRPTEYEVTYTVQFTVDAGDKELLPSQEVSATRSYSFDERLLLAKEHEESILREGMARDLADIVMRRLARL